MSSSLYKIVEIYDENEKKWKLAKNQGKYEFPCALATRDYLRHYNLADVNKDELSEELQELISKNDEGISPLKYRYHWLDESTLEDIRDEYIEKIINIADKKVKCDTNDKLNKIMDKLGVAKEDYDDAETVDDIKETLDYYVEILCGVEKDIAEINFIARMYSDKIYGAKRRVIVFYC